MKILKYFFIKCYLQLFEILKLLVIYYYIQLLELWPFQYFIFFFFEKLYCYFFTVHKDINHDFKQQKLLC